MHTLEGRDYADFRHVRVRVLREVVEPGNVGLAELYNPAAVMTQKRACTIPGRSSRSRSYRHDKPLAKRRQAARRAVAVTLRRTGLLLVKHVHVALSTM